MTTQTMPLMPKATAVWLVENTSLTFRQIAEFCGLHELEVKGIADGDVAAGIRGKDPISGGELTREEIRKAEADSGYRMKLKTSKVVLPEVKTKRGPRYTPVSRRQDRPNAIRWLLKFHPEMKDAQIIKLVGTTKPTIAQIKEGSHWNSANLVPQDPVTLGLCSQIDLDAEVQKAAKRVAKERAEQGDAFTPAGATLAATAETTGYTPPGMGEQPSIDEYARPTRSSEAADEARMLEQLKRMSSAPRDASEDDAPASIDAVFAKRKPEAEAETESETEADTETEPDAEISADHETGTEAASDDGEPAADTTDK